MKRTLRQIIETVSQKAQQMRTDAAYGGEHGDGGASRLEKELEFFTLGFKAYADTVPDKNYLDMFIDVPIFWQSYFYRQDPEYVEYIRLKNKFGDL